MPAVWTRPWRVRSYARRAPPTCQEMAGRVNVGLVSCEALGPDVATGYLLSHGMPLDTIVRGMTMPAKRRR